MLNWLSFLVLSQFKQDFGKDSNVVIWNHCDAFDPYYITVITGLLHFLLLNWVLKV